MWYTSSDAFRRCFIVFLLKNCVTSLKCENDRKLGHVMSWSWMTFGFDVRMRKVLPRKDKRFGYNYGESLPLISSVDH